MSMCKVLSHKGGGLYSVEVFMDDSGIAEKITIIDAEIIRLSAQIAEYALNVQAAYDDWNWYINRLDTLIPLLNSYPTNSSQWQSVYKDISETTSNGLNARNIYIRTKSLYNQLVSSKASLDIEKAKLAAIPALQNNILDVWCVDLADGQESRGIYAANEESELWCLNYDAGSTTSAKYLLPPKNEVISLTPAAHFNVPKAYPSIDDACMTFWNTAMEPGFAKWRPIIRSGVISLIDDDNEDRDCNDLVDSKDEDKKTIPVKIAGSNSRFGYPMAAGAINMSVDYFDGYKAFEDGDKVVVSPIITNGVIAGGRILGFVSNPKVYNPDEEGICPDVSTLRLLFSDTLTDLVHLGEIGNLAVDVYQTTISEAVGVWASDSEFGGETGSISFLPYEGMARDLVVPSDSYDLSPCLFKYVQLEAAHTIRWSYTGLLEYNEEVGEYTVYRRVAGVLIPWSTYGGNHSATGPTMNSWNYYSDRVTKLVSICVSTGAYTVNRERYYTYHTYNDGGRFYFNKVITTITQTVDCNGNFVEETTAENMYGDTGLTETRINQYTVYGSEEYYSEQSTNMSTPSVTVDRYESSGTC